MRKEMKAQENCHSRHKTEEHSIEARDDLKIKWHRWIQFKQQFNFFFLQNFPPPTIAVLL